MKCKHCFCIQFHKDGTDYEDRACCHCGVRLGGIDA